MTNELKDATAARPTEGQVLTAKKVSGDAVPLSEQQPIKSSESPRVNGGFLSLCKELYARFSSGECPVRAQALAFVGTLSLAPLLLCALAALSFLIRDPAQASDYITQVVKGLLPGKEAAQAADDLVRQAHVVESVKTLMAGKWWSIIIGLVTLFWGIISLVVSAVTPMNSAWEVRESRSFIKLRLQCTGAIVCAAILFVLSLLPSFGPSILSSAGILSSEATVNLSAFFVILIEAAAWVINIAMFVLLYKVLPDTKVSWRSAILGGAIAGLLWEIFKKGFAIYLGHAGSFNKAYGALGGVFLLVTWIYYSCMVLLGGAIICKMYHEHLEEGGVAKKQATVVPAAV